MKRSKMLKKNCFPSASDLALMEEDIRLRAEIEMLEMQALVHESYREFWEDLPQWRRQEQETPPEPPNSEKNETE